MSFLRKLFNRGEHAAVPATAASEPDPPCPHVTLVPRWDSNDDIGNDAKVAGYSCDACGAGFSREEGQRLMAVEKERVEEVVG